MRCKGSFRGGREQGHAALLHAHQWNARDLPAGGGLEKRDVGQQVALAKPRKSNAVKIAWHVLRATQVLERELES